MAARISRLELHEKWREKIRASMLINRLRNHVLGKIEMSPTQLRAAEILLKKVVPDLSAVNIEAHDQQGRPLAIALVAYQEQPQEPKAIEAQVTTH